MSLIDDARLTVEERIAAFWDSTPDLEAPLWSERTLEAIADAQLAKSLRAVLVWLGTADECREPLDDCVCVRLRAEMEKAGIKENTNDHP